MQLQEEEKQSMLHFTAGQGVQSCYPGSTLAEQNHSAQLRGT